VFQARNCIIKKEVDTMENKYDLIVAGGGFAGVAAAIEASREGLRVLLIEK
jgi:succinate dehydrogenase/fumarate reductase flavoprotein subunit